jgi:hypothetical protein
MAFLSSGKDGCASGVLTVSKPCSQASAAISHSVDGDDYARAHNGDFAHGSEGDEILMKTSEGS